MKKHIHGGNVYQYSDCVDFSANCNPLGTPEAVKQAIIQSLETVSDYPQVGFERLKRAIAEYESLELKQKCEWKDTEKTSEDEWKHEQRNTWIDKIEETQIICGNGAAELIFSLCRAVKPKKALLPAPTFAEYEQALRSVDCEIKYFFLKEAEEFRISEDFLQKLTPEFDMVFLCNPNNPTGVLTEREFLLKVLKRCKALDILLVVDECFLDFVEHPESYTLKELLGEYSNLFLLKAFTKRYAMAGVRLGYGLCGNPELLEQMEEMVQPWNVSSLAQAAGIAALKETDYVEKGRRMVFREKTYLIEEMGKLGLKIYPSEANYIFFHGPETLFQDCVERKVLIRDCGNYEGLEQGYYRVAVKRHEENEKLVYALEEILAAHDV